MTTAARAGLNPFGPAALDAETAEFNAKLEALMAGVTPTYLRQPQEIREEREAGGGTFGPIVTSELAQERTIAGVPCRLFVPQTVRGVYLHVHGGGWVLGRAHHSDLRTNASCRPASWPCSAWTTAWRPSIPIPRARTTARRWPSSWWSTRKRSSVRKRC